MRLASADGGVKPIRISRDEPVKAARFVRPYGDTVEQTLHFFE